MKNILSLNAKEARKFFLKHESYCNFDLPPYFKFDSILNDLSNTLKNTNLSNFYSSTKKPWDFEDVNYRLTSNKDGKYAWRPLQLIHPALYVNLAHIITEPKNWKDLKARFTFLMRESRNIECEGLPVISSYYRKDRAAQIIHWVDKVEKKSIKYALAYDYVLHTDITDCYGAIYTHSISWALHDKSVAKDRRHDDSLCGNKIDRQLQAMSNGQTNGIPQGSVLMDFIAELVLCYADSLLAQQISTIKKSEYRIIRYRDDYRIFTNHSQIAEQIMKELTDVLHNLGLKISSSKTKGTDKVVHSSIKEDKLYWFAHGRNHDKLLHELLNISLFAESFPNSGQLTILLNSVYYRIIDLYRKDIKEDITALISVAVDIAYKNPRVYPIATAIISKLIDFLPKSKREKAIQKILQRFKKLPNTGIMQIWLHRITVKLGGNYDHSERLCTKVVDPNVKIWNSDWLKTMLRRKIDICNVIDADELIKIGAVIGKDEVELFKVTDYSY